MKKLFKGVVLALVLILGVTFMCGFTNCFKEPEENLAMEWEDLPVNTTSHLKYFGYFHSDGFGSQPAFYDAIDNMQNSNVYMINSARNIESMRSALQRAKSVGKRAIVTIHGMFSAKKWGTTWLWMDGTELMMRSDLREYYTSVVNSLSEYINDGTLLAFYFDEPHWNGVPHDVFRETTRIMREVAPNVRLMNCMTIYDIGYSTFTRESDGVIFPQTTAYVNEYITDVMYDFYGNWDVKQRQDLLNKLKAVSPADAKIWGCANTHLNIASTSKDENGKYNFYELKRALIGMYKEALAEPRYEGIIGYTMASSDVIDFTHTDAVGFGLIIDKTSQFYDFEFKKLNVNIGRRVLSKGKLNITE